MTNNPTQLYDFSGYGQHAQWVHGKPWLDVFCTSKILMNLHAYGVLARRDCDKRAIRSGGYLRCVNVIDEGGFYCLEVCHCKRVVTKAVSNQVASIMGMEWRS